MPYDLDRFVRAQAASYAGALRELRAGRKTGHWIWFIFPQIEGPRVNSPRVLPTPGSAVTR